MSEYRIMASRQRKWMYLFIAITVVLALILPEKRVIYGLLLGLVISFYNLWLLQRRADMQGEEAARTGKRKGIGTISRLASAALGTLLAIRYDWSLVSFIIGLMAIYPVIMLDYIWFNRK
ncbi:MAG TPA: ATP synthase subunit I [Pseudogracilibacillus sp.]|nr:ATP synthase subunit I [Pseudogracilibacillus sp.]